MSGRGLRNPQPKLWRDTSVVPKRSAFPISILDIGGEHFPIPSQRRLLVLWFFLPLDLGRRNLHTLSLCFFSGLGLNHIVGSPLGCAFDTRNTNDTRLGLTACHLRWSWSVYHHSDRLQVPSIESGTFLDRPARLPSL